MPAGSVPIIDDLYKPTRYVNIRKVIKEWKKKTKSSDAVSKGELPSDHEIKQEIELRNRESIEKLEYSTGSCASLDEPSQHVTTTHFYFTPVLIIPDTR